jgi:hypothetical protein
MSTFERWLHYYFWLTMVIMPFVFVLIGVFGRKHMQEPRARRCVACGMDLHGQVSFPVLSYHVCANAKCLSAILVVKYDELTCEDMDRITKRIHQIRCYAVADKYRRFPDMNRRKPVPVEQDPQWKALIEGRDPDPDEYKPCDT